MVVEQHVGAVFEDREVAEAAVKDLQRLGLAEKHLGVAVHQADDYVLEENVGRDVAGGVARGIALGAPIGVLAGMTLLAVAISGVGTIGVAGLLTGGWVGALAGTYVGAFLGLSAEEDELEEEWDWERVPLQPGEVLVVVAGHGHTDRVAAIIERHGGRRVDRPPHLS